jgi:hypothetical protein
MRARNRSRHRAPPERAATIRQPNRAWKDSPPTAFAGAESFDTRDRPVFNLRRDASQRGEQEQEVAHHLEELARQVRRHTIELLNATPVDWLHWAPEGTSNHIIWHAGHAVWLQDVLGVQLLSGRSELPDGWAETFGSNCRPVRETEQWPSRDEIRALLQRQLERLLRLLHEASERLAADRVAERVIHGLHDEARHQGEMYLLLKLRRARGP